MNHYQNANEFLLDMCSMYNYTLSELETLMWQQRIFSQFSHREIINALVAHMEGPRGSFFPKYGEIRSILGKDTTQIDFERLVRSSSPYEAPEVENPVLRHAIVLLGGWVEVCQQMPDPVSRPIDYQHYMKRVDAAIVQAKHHVQVHGDPKHVLRGLSNAKLSNDVAAQQLALTHDAPRDHQVLDALTEFSAVNAP